MRTHRAGTVEKPSVLEQTIQVDGIPTRYLTVGNGPPLVLLHGAGDNARDWSRVLPLLGRSHRVLAPDLPGYGPGSAPVADYAPPRLAHFVARFLDAVGLDRAAVAGNSLGWPPSSWAARIPSGSGGRCCCSGDLVQLSWCGHAPQVECPERFAEALDQFLGA